MRIECPKCSYTKEVSNDTIPDGEDFSIQCPKCEHEFSVNNQDDEFVFMPKPAVGGEPATQKGPSSLQFQEDHKGPEGLKDTQSVEIKKVVKYTGAFWGIFIASIPALILTKALFGTAGSIITAIFLGLVLQSVKQHYICGSCGNSLEKTSTACPTCKVTTHAETEQKVTTEIGQTVTTETSINSNERNKEEREKMASLVLLVISVLILIPLCYVYLFLPERGNPVPGWTIALSALFVAFSIYFYRTVKAKQYD